MGYFEQQMGRQQFKFAWEVNIQIISKLCPYSSAEDPTLIFRGVSIHLRKLWDRCRCWLLMLSRPTGRRRRTNRRQFFISFYKRNGKPKLFIQHCSTWFSMVFPLTSFNISIVGFWGGFADESLFQGARTLGEDLSEATAAAGPGEIQVGCWALGIWAIEYHGFNEISWDLMGF